MKYLAIILMPLLLPVLFFASLIAGIALWTHFFLLMIEQSGKE